jgi:hypothetical protein
MIYIWNGSFNFRALGFLIFGAAQPEESYTYCPKNNSSRVHIRHRRNNSEIFYAAEAVSGISALQEVVYERFNQKSF